MTSSWIASRKLHNLPTSICFTTRRVITSAVREAHLLWISHHQGWVHRTLICCQSRGRGDNAGAAFTETASTTCRNTNVRCKEEATFGGGLARARAAI